MVDCDSDDTGAVCHSDDASPMIPVYFVVELHVRTATQAPIPFARNVCCHLWLTLAPSSEGIWFPNTPNEFIVIRIHQKCSVCSCLRWRQSLLQNLAFAVDVTRCHIKMVDDTNNKKELEMLRTELLFYQVHIYKTRGIPLLILCFEVTKSSAGLLVFRIDVRTHRQN